MRNHSAVLRAALGMLLMLGVGEFACAQKTYPSKPIRMIVPFAPGGGVSNVARIIGPKLTESWVTGRVDNRPGATRSSAPRHW